jgi:hypothetical protein
MHTLRIILGILVCFILSSRAGEVLWKAELVHYDLVQPPYDAWVVSRALEAGPQSQQLTNVLATIHAKDKNARIAHVYLGGQVGQKDLQSDVVSYLEKQESFKKTPPPSGQGAWTFKNIEEIKKLVAEGLMQSKFANSINAALAPQKKRITSVSMEKLLFTKKDGKTVWNAIVWFKID